jgi:hypothetical protein
MTRQDTRTDLSQCGSFGTAASCRANVRFTCAFFLRRHFAQANRNSAKTDKSVILSYLRQGGDYFRHYTSSKCQYCLHILQSVLSVLTSVLTNRVRKTAGRGRFQTYFGAQKMPDVSTTTASKKATARSHVTNGSLGDQVDGRSRSARRFRDILDALICEYDATAESELALCRRYAGLAVWCEAEEAKLARGESADVAGLVTAGNSLRRYRRDLAASRRMRMRSQRGAA